MAKEAAAPHDVAGLAQAPLERFLTIPPLGYAREHQERGQAAMQDWLAYQRAAGAFTAVMTRIATRTTDMVQRRFTERAASGPPLESLRQAYDLFVDCAEQAYAEVVTAADFGKVSADLMNAAMAVKRHVQAAAEEMASAANLPTRRELDTSHRQLQQLKRQIQAMRDEMQRRPSAPAAGDSHVAALEREVQRLRDEVAELRARTDMVPARAATGAKGRPARVQKVEG
jgi:class III poly(R)-hydroxyalkanoic acid synthase PhaE subunit